MGFNSGFKGLKGRKSTKHSREYQLPHTGRLLMKLFTYVCGIKFDAKECQPSGDSTLTNTANARCLLSDSLRNKFCPALESLVCVPFS